MENKQVVINELTFSNLVELGEIATQKGGIPKEIVEKTLNRIASENKLSSQFLC